LLKEGLLAILSSKPPTMTSSYEGKKNVAEKAKKGYETSAGCILQKSLVTSYSAILFVSHLATLILRRSVECRLMFRLSKRF